MKYSHLLAVAILATAAVSCSAPKDINYFQNIEAGSTLTNTAISQITFQPLDEVFINVSCADERLTDQFNLSRAQGSQSSGGSDNILSYLVDSEGYIDFPILGRLHIGGMTREQVANYIKDELQKNDLVKDPVVTVKFVNLGVVVLGEVASPGRIRISRDKFTILDAIAQAGDLTINGVRTNVKVIRDEGEEDKVYVVNLTNAMDVYSSPVYYLQQEDVIYVEPNPKAARASTENGNTLMTYGFWMSVATFLMSIGVLIFK